MTEYIFWIAILVIFYTYIGYGLLLVALTSARKRVTSLIDISDDKLPSVTLVVAAYNEEAFIRRKVENSLQLNYPKNKISFYFVTDGSSDATRQILAEFADVKVFHEPARRGKIHAVNRVMDVVSSPITVFSDANTFLNRDAIRKIVRHYEDPRIGGVAGEKKIYMNDADNASGSGEGLYWKYESFLKRKDAELYSIVGAAGELFSIRTKLYEKPGADTIIEDFYLSMRIVARGHRFAYEPLAIASETASSNVKEEWKRKVRICAGGFQAMTKLGTLLNPFRYGWLSFQYFSHRVLRWTLAPLCLPIAFIANLFLAWKGIAIYQVLLAFHVLFYGLALIGHAFRDRRVSIPGFFVPYYFTVMNAAVYAGFKRYLHGSQTVTWERAERAQASQE